MGWLGSKLGWFGSKLGCIKSMVGGLSYKRLRIDNPAQMRVGEEVYPRTVIFDPKEKNCHFQVIPNVNAATLRVVFKFNPSVGTKHLVVTPMTSRIRTYVTIIQM